MIDSVKAVSEMHRVLKKDGIFVLGIFLYPTLIAIARRFIERWIPFFQDKAHPYSYTRRGIKKLLENFFTIQREIMVYRKDSAIVPALHREDWMFICRKKS